MNWLFLEKWVEKHLKNLYGIGVILFKLKASIEMNDIFLSKIYIKVCSKNVYNMHVVYTLIYLPPDRYAFHFCHMIVMHRDILFNVHTFF